MKFIHWYNCALSALWFPHFKMWFSPLTSQIKTIFWSDIDWRQPFLAMRIVRQKKLSISDTFKRYSFLTIPPKAWALTSDKIGQTIVFFQYLLFSLNFLLRYYMYMYIYTHTHREKYTCNIHISYIHAWWSFVSCYLCKKHKEQLTLFLF